MGSEPARAETQGNGSYSNCRSRKPTVPAPSLSPGFNALGVPGQAFCEPELLKANKIHPPILTAILPEPLPASSTGPTRRRSD